MGEYFIQQGLAGAPELLQLDAQIAASERQLLSAERSFWSPEIGLSSQISEVLGESRVAGESQEGENDWQIGINFFLPLFQGGARKAQVNRVTHELNQLQFQRDATRDRVEQSIRANLHAVRASFPSIELAQDAAEAARKNLDLVRDNYSQGTVSIIDLLDAQTASLDAEQAATDAAYNFLIDLMNLQRSVAAFDFFLDDPGRDQAAQAIKDYVSAGGAQQETQ
jgi:outer membrane protein TolC